MNTTSKSLFRPIAGFVGYIGKAAATLGTTMLYIVRLAVDVPLTIFQMSTMGINSIPIVFLVVGFTGMILSVQIAGQAVRFGTTQYLGGGIAFVMVRELAPVLTAVVMAGRVGSAIASELGSMKVTEQIDALRSLATNPVQYLVVPRMVALIVMIPAISVMAALAGVLASFAVARGMFGIEWEVFYSYIPRLLEPRDVTASVIKSLVFAVTIALVGCVEGMNAEGGAVGVGRATTNAVVVSIVSIFGLNYILTVLLFRV
jgi:phospholipid/cholesterol/gamma-HCH transport system permease protein